MSFRCTTDMLFHVPFSINLRFKFVFLCKNIKFIIIIINLRFICLNTIQYRYNRLNVTANLEFNHSMIVYSFISISLFGCFQLHSYFEFIPTQSFMLSYPFHFLIHPNCLNMQRDERNLSRNIQTMLSRQTHVHQNFAIFAQSPVHFIIPNLNQSINKKIVKKIKLIIHHADNIVTWFFFKTLDPQWYACICHQKKTYQVSKISCHHRIHNYMEFLNQPKGGKIGDKQKKIVNLGEIIRFASH